jgi:dethiobiotin synthetase
MADLAIALEYPVILVVGLRLGCLNHAMLSQHAIMASGVPLAGWIGCQMDPDMAHVPENLGWLRGALGAPCLGVIPWLSDAKADTGLYLQDIFEEEVLV